MTVLRIARIPRDIPMIHLRTLVLLSPFLANLCWADGSSPRIGDAEKVYMLAPGNTNVRGLAWDEVTPDAPRLFALDASGTLFCYQPGDEHALEAIKTYDLQRAVADDGLDDPRGLTFALTESDCLQYRRGTH